jgi:hypothetical protein
VAVVVLSTVTFWVVLEVVVLLALDEVLVVVLETAETAAYLTWSMVGKELELDPTAAKT